MMITGRQMVAFLNVSDSILGLRIPKKLYSAIAMNRMALEDAARVHNEQHEKIIDQYVKKDADGNPVMNGRDYAYINKAAYLEEVKELLELERDVNLQVVDASLFDRMDEMEKFDSLSGYQYGAIDFMIEKE